MAWTIWASHSRSSIMMMPKWNKLWYDSNFSSKTVKLNTTFFLSQTPFIQLQVHQEVLSRKKRMTGLDCDDKSSENRCCRYPLTVDFEQFGWDWIIAPKRYEAHYCTGDCPMVFMAQFPHTHLVQQVGSRQTAGPCCSPRRMSSISMLYMDADFNIIYGILPNMVVDRCGCSWVPPGLDLDSFFCTFVPSSIDLSRHSSLLFLFIVIVILFSFLLLLYSNWKYIKFYIHFDSVWPDGTGLTAIRLQIIVHQNESRTEESSLLLRELVLLHNAIFHFLFCVGVLHARFNQSMELFTRFFWDFAESTRICSFCLLMWGSCSFLCRFGPCSCYARVTLMANTKQVD